MQNVIGIDIGGTKCAVTLGRHEEGSVTFPVKYELETVGSCPEMLGRIGAAIRNALETCTGKGREVSGIGIVCGGPLDGKKGMILSPPNLPGWDDVSITDHYSSLFGLPAWLSNDADACAVAEWKFGAGRGCNNVIFLTFGTGMGSGLILDGKLYTGTNNMAGECGHVRLSEFGPAGYGKTGSFEGYCSGGGIAQIGSALAAARLQLGKCPPFASGGNKITAKTISVAACGGDETALEAYRISGQMLGRGLAILVDILNPEVIIIGSIFSRSRELLWPHAQEVLEREALGRSLSACRVVPSGLGESLGDYAAVTLALYQSGALK